jgi:hypothetical protein
MSTKKISGEHKSEVRIAIANVTSELAFDCPLTAEDIRSAVTIALASGSPLVLNDVRGKEIIVPSDKIGYVEIGEQTERRVGFGTN